MAARKVKTSMANTVPTPEYDSTNPARIGPPSVPTASASWMRPDALPNWSFGTTTAIAADIAGHWKAWNKPEIATAIAMFQTASKSGRVQHDQHDRSEAGARVGEDHRLPPVPSVHVGTGERRDEDLPELGRGTTAACCVTDPVCWKT